MSGKKGKGGKSPVPHDVLYSLKTTEGEGYIYTLIEHLCGAPHKCSYAKKMIM